MDLEKSLYTIVECEMVLWKPHPKLTTLPGYLTPQQQALFGSIPNEILSEAPSPPPSPSPPTSRSSSSASTSSLSSLSDSMSLSSLTSLSSSPDDDQPRIPLLRAVQRAIHTQNGPLFLKAMEQINNLLSSFKCPQIPDDMFTPLPPNILKQTVASWTGKGIPKKVLLRIIEENYQRSVGPNVPKLKRYEAFSSTVYGELMPTLIYEMIQITKLNENSLFLDLGSGVGNVVVQASLQAGCRSYGIELLPEPANVARNMLEHLKVRCRMWGLRFGEVELEEGNMLQSRRVDELIPKADVVLVDNKVFEESCEYFSVFPPVVELMNGFLVNEALRPKFLDLKEGAIVISLKPFVSSLNARVTERNVSLTSAPTSRVSRFAGRRHQHHLRRHRAPVLSGQCLVGEQRWDLLFTSC
jgi:[histone H3]-lysine79 N-trimethyltransferase